MLIKLHNADQGHQGSGASFVMRGECIVAFSSLIGVKESNKSEKSRFNKTLKFFEESLPDNKQLITLTDGSFQIAGSSGSANLS